MAASIEIAPTPSAMKIIFREPRENRITDCQGDAACCAADCTGTNNLGVSKRVTIVEDIHKLENITSNHKFFRTKTPPCQEPADSKSYASYLEQLYRSTGPKVLANRPPLCVLRGLRVMGRFPLAGANNDKLPLRTTDGSIGYVNFDCVRIDARPLFVARPNTVLRPTDHHRKLMMYLRSSPAASSYYGSRVHTFRRPPFSPDARVDVTMHCYRSKTSKNPRCSFCLTGAVLVINTWSGRGPCLYLSTPQGDLEFTIDCTERTFYSYAYWEEVFATLDCRLMHPKDLFSIQLKNFIGRGSFGYIAPAIHMLSGKQYCIKIMSKCAVFGSVPADLLTAFHAEVDVLWRIRHPFVVQFQTAFEDENFLYIVLEKLEGGSLWDRINIHGAYSEKEARVVAGRLLVTMADLAQKGIVHRDLKPENIMFERDDDATSVKLIDFGLAALVGTPRMRMRCGSPGFVAPELISNELYTASVDVFSLGVTLYYLLSGATPFHNEEPGANGDLLSRNEDCNWSFDAPRFKHVSAEAKDLLASMMQKDPRDRVTAVDALLHPWFAACDHPKFPFEQAYQSLLNAGVEVPKNTKHDVSRSFWKFYTESHSVYGNAHILDACNNKSLKDSLSPEKENNTMVDLMVTKFPVCETEIDDDDSVRRERRIRQAKSRQLSILSSDSTIDTRMTSSPATVPVQVRSPVEMSTPLPTRSDSIPITGHNSSSSSSSKVSKASSSVRKIALPQEERVTGPTTLLADLFLYDEDYLRNRIGDCEYFSAENTQSEDSSEDGTTNIMKISKRKSTIGSLRPSMDSMSIGTSITFSDDEEDLLYLYPGHFPSAGPVVTRLSLLASSSSFGNEQEYQLC